MKETNQCSIETRKDGVDICALHMEPLFETTSLEKKEEGKDYAEFKLTFFCPTARKEFSLPWIPRAKRLRHLASQPWGERTARKS